ncbi:gustatory receptor for sugar taste 43a [Drosophila subobscura]|uniref:gustatory receptor for sugar taste 43a n=1 Tax=Drosophila subobscura TaxID=7241 RepID=UPI00155B12CC|nr:gustatory receptor for sugar taste 43a [Drosophila subobscura]
MEISEPSIGIFYISKLLALAPYATRKNSKGQYEIRRSWLFSIYSASLTVAMVFLTYRGLLFDANAKIPVRMKSATSKVVTALDVSVVVLAVVSGVYCGLLSLSETLELNARLYRIDNTLNACTHSRRDRWRALGMAGVSLLTISALLGLDVGTWMHKAEEMNISDSDTELNVHWYIPFYCLYFILTGLHLNFANTAYGLGRRFRRLNQMLSSSFLGEPKECNDALKLRKMSTVKTVSTNATMTPTALHSSLTKLSSEMLPNESAAKNKSLLIQTMADNHDSLTKCVLLLSNSFGIAVLFILVSCLLHLVATAYFLFLELLSKRDDAYMWVQALWILLHSFRLLMVVEPCHLAARESRKTIQIVCEIERKVHEPILAEAVKKFWQQLLVVDSDFSASGLCRVNRNILTSFASAIATYLVILIQFQKTNG